MNTFGTKTVILLAVIGFLTGRPDWVDLSLVYALINFIGTIAVLKFFEYGDLGRSAHPSRGSNLMSMAADVLSWACILAGLFFMLVGTLGVLRMPDVYSRLHAAGMTDTMGAGFLFVGMSFQAGWSLLALRLLLVYALPALHQPHRHPRPGPRRAVRRGRALPCAGAGRLTHERRRRRRPARASWW